MVALRLVQYSNRPPNAPYPADHKQGGTRLQDASQKCPEANNTFVAETRRHSYCAETW